MTELETALPREYDLVPPPTAVPHPTTAAVARRRRIGLAAVCLLALLMGGAQITDESYVSLQGDMPRHLMNGVFLTDLLRDRPFTSLDTFLEYTNLYFGRYPALSLGHHPPLLAALQVPLFAIFGPSVWAGRVVPLISLVAAAALLYLLVVRRYGIAAACVSGALFVTSPAVVNLSQSVLSEVPAIALFLAAVVSLERFWTTGRRGPLVGFVIAASLSLYAKQLIIFAFPAFLFMSLVTVGWRRLLRRDIVMAAAAIALLSVPLAVLTLELSPSNIKAVATTWMAAENGVGTPLREALFDQFHGVALALAGAGLLLALIRREARGVLFTSWIAGIFLGLFIAGQYSPARYSIYWVPALCAMAGSVVAGWRRPFVRHLLIVATIVAAILQTKNAASVRLQGAEGYEDAARFVLASDPAPTVLYGADVDTGFFTFFVRKHDAERRLVVLRAEKLLRPGADLRHVLQRFGTRYIIVEDRQRGAPLSFWLRKELQSPPFVERTRIPIGSRDARLRDSSLVIYEFMAATPPASDTALSMQMPVVGRSLEVPLADLIARKHLR